MPLTTMTYLCEENLHATFSVIFASSHFPTKRGKFYLIPPTSYNINTQQLNILQHYCFPALCKIFHFNMKEIKMNTRAYTCLHTAVAAETAAARATSTAAKWRATLKYGSKSHATAAASGEPGLCKWMHHNATQVYLTLTHSFTLSPSLALCVHIFTAFC